MDVIFALGEAGVEDPEDATKKKKTVKSIPKESKVDCRKCNTI